MFLTKILTRISSPRHLSVDYDSILPKFPYSAGIPRFIVQTYKSKNCLPEEVIANIQTIKSLNPTWQYQLYDDSDIEKYILDNYGAEIFHYYKRIDSSYGAARADFFRYLRIYKDGGVYLDIKSSIKKPLDDNIYSTDRMLLSYWGNSGNNGQGQFYSALPTYITKGEIIQWAILSCPGHPFLRELIIAVLKNIDSYNPYTKGVGWTGTVCATGPVVYSEVMFKCTSQNENSEQFRWVNLIDDLSFVYSIYRKEGNPDPVHAKVLGSDYRKELKPLIINRHKLMQLVNVYYLKLMSKFKRRYDS